LSLPTLGLEMNPRKGPGEQRGDKRDGKEQDVIEGFRDEAHKLEGKKTAVERRIQKAKSGGFYRVQGAS
jgi:hypothetical protein